MSAIVHYMDEKEFSYQTPRRRGASVGDRGPPGLLPDDYHRPVQYRQARSYTFNFLQVSPVFFNPIRPAHYEPARESTAAVGSRYTKRSFSTADLSQQQGPHTKELMFLYERLHTTEFRQMLVQSLPRLAGQIANDNVFLNLFRLPELPREGNDSPSADSDTSWGGQSDRRASTSLFNDFYRIIGNRNGISNMALILGMRFVHAYRKALREHMDGRNRSSSVISLADETSPAPPLTFIKSSYHLLIVGLMLANKYTEDRPHSNASWARITGFEARVLNKLEGVFLSTVGHDIFVREWDFKDWILCLSRILQWVPNQQRIIWCSPAVACPRVVYRVGGSRFQQHHLQHKEQEDRREEHQVVHAPQARHGREDRSTNI